MLPIDVASHATTPPSLLKLFLELLQVALFLGALGLGCLIAIIAKQVGQLDAGLGETGELVSFVYTCCVIGISWKMCARSSKRQHWK